MCQSQNATGSRFLPWQEVMELFGLVRTFLQGGPGNRASSRTG